MEEEIAMEHEEFRRLIDHHNWEAGTRERIAVEELARNAGKKAYTLLRASYHRRLEDKARQLYKLHEDKAPLRHYVDPKTEETKVCTMSYFLDQEIVIEMAVDCLSRGSIGDIRRLKVLAEVKGFIDTCGIFLLVLSSSKTGLLFAP